MADNIEEIYNRMMSAKEDFHQVLTDMFASEQITKDQAVKISQYRMSKLSVELKKISNEFDGLHRFLSTLG